MSTTGVSRPATQVITVSVYGVDEALVTVSENAGSVVDGSTSGKRLPKSRTTAARVTTLVSRKPSPSRRARAASVAPTRPAAATPTASQVQALPWASWVQTAKTQATTTGTGAMRAARATARSRSSPVVLSPR